MNTGNQTDGADGFIGFHWRHTMLLGLAWTCLIGPYSVWAVQEPSCVGTPPIEQTIYQADLIYLGTVTVILPDGRVQFRRVEAIKGQVDATLVLPVDGQYFLAGHTYVVFAQARTTADDANPSYRIGCAPAPEIVGDDRRLVDRIREIAREQSRTTERPHVGIYPPKKIKDAAAIWPRQAHAPQDSAAVTVILEVTITADGVVSDVRVLRSVPFFDQAAVEAARRWEYLPALVNGVAMPVTITEAVVFKRQ